jgi:broad specificity phosphatase PhoE
MRLILVRHGETDWNRQMRVQGRSDVELNETGRRQVQALASALKEESFEAIYASPLKRSLQTAQAINLFHGVEIEVDDGLKELDVGDFDGLRGDELRARFSSFWQRWTSDEAASVRFPHGESLQQLRRRAWAALQRINQRHRHGAVVAVSHYFVITSIICETMGLDLSRFRRFRPLDATAVSIIDLEESRATLKLFNDTCHLTKEV